jgi:NAD(P)-dependent dehydrogenase (short-subunit alcohol dehydrogenase family)
MSKLIEQLSLAGSVAVVTGGAGAIGQAITRDLTGLGATVGVLDRDVAGAERVAQEVGGAGAACDIADAASIARALDDVRSQLGPIDILVNNAGVLSTTPFLDLEPEEWERTLQVNLSGTFRMSRACVPEMIERRRGRIVNVASIAAKRGGGVIATTAYVASKAGVIGFTKALARELAPYGITVNGVAPGVVTSAMTERLAREPQLHARVVAGIPLGRAGSADEISPIVAVLASNLAGYMTGETVNVDGGVVME